MPTPITNSRRLLLRRLFFVCETLLIGSFVVMDLLFRLYTSHHRPGEPRFGEFFYLSFMGSLVALLILGFFLRRTDRTLAIIGWASALGLFLYGSFG